MNRKRQLIGIAACLVLSLSVLEIWTVNRLASYGVEINNLEKAKSDLSIENQLLEKKIAEKQSLRVNEKISKNLGFERIKNFQYFKDHNLALNK